MSTKHLNAPAFPTTLENRSHETVAGFYGGTEVPPHTTQAYAGMSLRDCFAAKAMQGFVSSYPEGGVTCDFADIADDAYAIADAMLKARQA